MRADPAKLSEPGREKWVAEVASALDRLPPGEVEKLVATTAADPAWHERFRSLAPEQRRKIADHISRGKQIEMMAQMVEMLKNAPPPVREAMLRQGRERMRQGGSFTMTKEQIAQHHASTTPTQRARFVRAMRELRKMADEAGVKD